VSQLYVSYDSNRESTTLVTRIEDVSLDIDTAIPCGLVLNELVSNAMKYAFPNGKRGEITISMSSEEGRVTLTVSDNGIGFPEELDFRNTESLGMQLVTELVEQLDGTIELIRGEGTEFRIVFAAP
jgi:two-component system, sensor histidine kinase PdtaS